MANYSDRLHSLCVCEQKYSVKKKASSRRNAEIMPPTCRPLRLGTQEVDAFCKSSERLQFVGTHVGLSVYNVWHLASAKDTPQPLHRPLPPHTRAVPPSPIICRSSLLSSSGWGGTGSSLRFSTKTKAAFQFRVCLLRSVRPS